MPGVATTGSPNIAFLDSKIIADLCAGKFYVDVTPSIYIAGGAANVLGANVQITSPFGIVIKPYGSNYEIAPGISAGMDTAISWNIPTTAGTFVYGKYTIDVKLFDGDNSWVVTKTVTVCAPDKNNKLKNFGKLSALLQADCRGGRLTVIVDNVPTYNGEIAESQVNTLTLEYPTSSGKPVLNTAIGSFSVVLFEGVYKLNGEICATYNFGDNVYVRVKYKVKREKNVRCLIDECCVFDKLSELRSELKSNCTAEDAERIGSIMLEALGLLKAIQLAGECGQDASDFITDLEKLLGCQCTCNCEEGTPIARTTPSKDFVLTGCNVTKTVVGLTEYYTIDNFDFVVEVVPNGGALTITSSIVSGCEKKQTLAFNIAVTYQQIKNLISSDTEFWNSFIQQILESGDIEVINDLQDAINACCGCDGSVSNIATSQSGADASVQFDVSSNVFSADVYLDGTFKGNVLTVNQKTGLSITFPGAADALEHNVTIVPKCSNGKVGTLGTATFQYLGCPDIAPPTVSSNNVNGVECPFDLTSILTAPPAGITVEWHTANNTSPASLVGNPAAVSSGIYYAFSKDASGCFSDATQVTVLCDAGTSCSAPQSIAASKFGPFQVLVSFQSAAYPPPSNSYTVKRRLFTDPDVDGSYTTIGTPTWNASLQRWTIFDSSFSDNTLYVYKAISNCADSPATTPSVSISFANITCHTVNATPGTDSIDYSLSTTGLGQIDKYEVNIYDSSGAILIHTDTFTPPFGNPITGTFDYLTPGTTYLIKVTAYIGTYSKTSCSTLTTATLGNNYVLTAAFNLSIDSVSGTGVPSLPATGVNGSQTGHHTGITGALSVDISGTVVVTTKLVVLKNNVQVACVDIPAAGTYVTASIASTEADEIRITINNGSCT